VIVDVLAPSAGIEVGDAVICEVAPDAAPGVIENEELVEGVNPPPIATSV
jgi:hypothetical protein